MQKIEKSVQKKEVNKKTKKGNNHFALIFVGIIFLISLGIAIGYWLRIKKENNNKNNEIIKRSGKKEISFENKELFDAIAYSFDNNNIYAMYNTGETKKLYGFEDNNKTYINSLVYKEGMIYFSIHDENENINNVKFINLNKGNGRYDVENTDLSIKQLSLIGCYDKYLYYFKSYSAIFDNNEYGYVLYKYDLKENKEYQVLDGLVSSVKISENGKIYYAKSFAQSVNNKTKIIKSNLYSYNVSDDKKLLIKSIKFNDYYGNIVPFEIESIHGSYLVFSYDTRDKTFYYKYDIINNNVYNLITDNRYTLSCDNDGKYLLCLKNIKDNKKDLLIYNLETNQKIYESNNVTNNDLESAFILPNKKFDTMYINLGPGNTTNIFDLKNQKFIEEDSNLTNFVIKPE